MFFHAVLAQSLSHLGPSVTNLFFRVSLLSFFSSLSPCLFSLTCFNFHDLCWAFSQMSLAATLVLLYVINFEKMLKISDLFANILETYFFCVSLCARSVVAVSDGKSRNKFFELSRNIYFYFSAKVNLTQKENFQQNLKLLKDSH